MNVIRTRLFLHEWNFFNEIQIFLIQLDMPTREKFFVRTKYEMII